jgi:hypothetical protein
MAINPKGRKPKKRQTTMKTLADWGNRSLKPEREEHEYEFSNGTITKKAGKGAYAR